MKSDCDGLEWDMSPIFEPGGWGVIFQRNYCVKEELLLGYCTL